MEEKELYLNFDEYIRQGEPAQKEKAGYWQAAIGLQAVDGLKVSDYLQDTARKHIEGEITIDEARELIKTYYLSKTKREPDDDEKQEADKVSANITKILSSRTLDFSTKGYIALHRRIFEGVMKHAGELRKYDITKKEWVLEYDTVNYLNWEDLRRALDYDIEQERNFSYRDMGPNDIITHITKFVSGIWQIHAFGEGNTRTTAVFAIQYLRSIGFEVNNDLFARHSWYFRNALVRSNYKNAKKGIDYSPVYLERFFRNLLFGEQWDLRNRYLHINPTEEWKVQPNLATPASTPAARPKVACYQRDARSTGQAPDKLPDKFSTNNMYIKMLVEVVGCNEVTIKDALKILGLKDRESFMNVYLNPALKERFLCMKYPKSPHHPRQRYLLTTKGLMLYNTIKELKE